MRVRQTLAMILFCGLAFAGGLTVAGLAFGNAAPPDFDREPPRPAPGSPVVLILQGEGEPLRVEVSRGMVLHGERVGPGAADGSAPRRGLLFFDFGTIGTIIGGAALSLAIAMGGLWIAGRMRKSMLARQAVKAAAMLIAVGMLGGAVGVAWADIAVEPPPERPATKSDMTGTVTVVRGGDAIKVYVSPSQARKFAALAEGEPGARSTPPSTGAAPPVAPPKGAPPLTPKPLPKPSK